MKAKLEELYQQNSSLFKGIIKKFPSENIMGPLLMSATEKYQTSDVKLLIVGQETKGWGYHSENIKQGMADYEKFNLGERYYASPFWNVTRKVERALGNTPHSCAWSNVNKFDFEGRRPTGDIMTEISKVDNLLIKEIQILKPDVIVFFTGPNFDFRLKEIFEYAEFKSVDDFSIAQCAVLKHPHLPSSTIRTYHPNYLRRRKLEDKFISVIKGMQ